ncbi:MAG: hypothetical protein FWD75_09730 [Propionibacteriaceae bacterium]|nr:hypothetical protein [Propionibacteriaceae bacterium]
MPVLIPEASTSIKVSQSTHRKLKAGAKDYRSINDYLDYLLRLEERQRRVESMRQAIAATPPEHRASWLAESAAWESTSLADAR